MGSIKSYTTQSGRRYRVLYRRPDHRQTSKRGFRTKREAELFLASVELSKSRGAYIDPARSKVLLDTWMKDWVDHRADLRPSSRDRMAGIVNLHVRPKLGRYPLAEFDHISLQKWASDLALSQSPASVRKCVNVLSGSLQAAVNDGRLPANPARGLKLPKSVTTRRRYLCHEDVRKLAAAVNRQDEAKLHARSNSYGAIVRVLAYCGLRWGELSGLRVGDLDVDRGRLEVRHTVVEVNGEQVESTPKNYEARSVPVPATLLRELSNISAGRAAGDALFPSPRSGSWLRGRTFRRGWFDEAAAQVGLEGLTLHELRHTAASLAISAGANVKAVQRMLGHASAAVTLDTYSDLFDTDLDAVSAALDLVLSQQGVANLLPDLQSSSSAEMSDHPRHSYQSQADQDF